MKRKLYLVISYALLSVGSLVTLQAMQEQQEISEQRVLPSALDVESKVPEDFRKFFEEQQDSPSLAGTKSEGFLEELKRKNQLTDENLKNLLLIHKKS